MPARSRPPRAARGARSTLDTRMLLMEPISPPRPRTRHQRSLRHQLAAPLEHVQALAGVAAGSGAHAGPPPLPQPRRGGAQGLRRHADSDERAGRGAAARDWDWDPAAVDRGAVICDPWRAQCVRGGSSQLKHRRGRFAALSLKLGASPRPAIPIPPIPRPTKPAAMALRRFATSTLSQLGLRAQPWAASAGLNRGFAKGARPCTRLCTPAIAAATHPRPRPPQWWTASSMPSPTSGPSWRATS
jgi:hypothetical protein